MMLVLHRRHVRRRVRVVARERATGGAIVTVGRLVERIAPAATELVRDDADPHATLGAVVLASVTGAIVGAGAVEPARAVAGAALGGMGGAWSVLAVRRRSRAREDEQARRALPVLLDRWTACVRAGMGVERALRASVGSGRGRLADAVAEGLRALDAGIPRSRAYALIARHAGIDEVRAVLDAVARAERFGTPVGDVLLAQAERVRATARAAAEAGARTAPVRLVFPLVFCFLPAFVVLTIAPIAITAFRTVADA